MPLPPATNRKIEATIRTGSSKLHNRRLETHSLDFCCNITDLEFVNKNKKMDPSCPVSKVQTGAGGIVIFSWHTLGAPLYEFRVV